MTGRVPPRSVPPTKLTEYLLKPGHPAGGPKAAFFLALGFSIDRLDVMQAALVAHPDRNAVEAVRTDRWGVRYMVRCRITTPDGRDPCIRTIWIVPPGDDTARLVTAYPADP